MSKIETQHTPGRALLDEDEPIVRGEDGERIANCYRLFDGDPAKTPEETGMANARRLVACWNACEDFSTEAIEDGAPLKLREDRDQLLKERDEFLTALGDCRDAMPHTTANISEAISFPTSVPAYVRESVSLLVTQRDELLAAAKDFSDYVRDVQHSEDGAVTYATTQINRLVFKARAAIAKAEVAT